MRNSNFALRLQESLLDEARRVAEQEGVALNQFINVAVAEKLSAIRTAAFFAERRARANIPEALAILARAGRGNPPMPGDELPPGWTNRGLGEGAAPYAALRPAAKRVMKKVGKPKAGIKAK
ncbi:MAG: toxin-antitoxin system HicB family antitoxin [Rhodospirillaceae bacterium]|nr:toxin-antitoxin system HicB family antitoxin [Rhodospirillaceae bacterium]